jgi:hypothetical protein
MNIVKLPVSPFTKKLIIAQYGQQLAKADESCLVTSLKATDPLTGELTCTKAGDSNKIEKTLAMLTDCIFIQLTPTVAKQVNSRRWRVGLHLDAHFRNKLNEYIEEKESEGKGISNPIKTYCFKNGVELDVDINYETLYKDYQRFKEEKEKKSGAFFSLQQKKYVRLVGQKSAIFLKGIELFSDAQLDTIIEDSVQNVTWRRTQKIEVPTDAVCIQNHWKSYPSVYLQKISTNANVYIQARW